MARTPSKKRRKDGRFLVSVCGVPFYSYVSWADANRQAQAYKRELESGMNVDARRMTLRQYALQWLPIHKAGCKNRTYNEYARYINNLINVIGDIPIQNITLDDALGAFVKIYPPKQAVGDKDGYSGTVMRKAKMIYRELFDSAIENGYALRNPFRSEKFKPTMGVDGTHREITDEERNLIHTIKHPFRLAAMIMLYAGLRRGEVLALDADTDIVDGYIVVRRAISYESNQPIIDTPKTKSGIRRVPVFSVLADELQDVHGLIAASATNNEFMSEQSFSNAWSSYVLTIECHINGVSQKRWYGRRKIDRQTNPEKFHAVMKLQSEGKQKEAEELRLSDWKTFSVRPHDLRHSFCTMCRDAGVDIKQTIEWMGHADEKMIMKIYDHVTAYRSRKSIDKIHEFIKNEVNSGQNNGQRHQDI